MTFNDHFTFNSVFCHAEVEDLFIYLYGQRHDDI